MDRYIYELDMAIMIAGLIFIFGGIHFVPIRYGPGDIRWAIHP